MTEEPTTSVYEKLTKARDLFHAENRSKSGRNDFIKYSYFELSDFLPAALKAFSEAGLCGIVSFPDKATLRIVDVKTREETAIEMQIAEANVKGASPAQNTGAVQTYFRRYLWMAAMELTENDILDSGNAVEDKKPEVVPKQDRIVAKAVELFEAKPQLPPWEGVVEKLLKFDGIGKTGKPFTKRGVQLDDGRHAGTFEKDYLKDISEGDYVTVPVKPAQRTGYFDLAGPVKPAQRTLDEEFAQKEADADPY